MGVGLGKGDEKKKLFLWKVQKDIKKICSFKWCTLYLTIEIEKKKNGI